jgi:hypothetical protein
MYTYVVVHIYNPVIMNNCDDLTLPERNYIQDDSKLLSVFPWPIIFKP